jgi:hypothetical protein
LSLKTLAALTAAIASLEGDSQRRHVLVTADAISPSTSPGSKSQKIDAETVGRASLPYKLQISP